MHGQSLAPEAAKEKMEQKMRRFQFDQNKNSLMEIDFKCATRS